jgi:hypothetical protein
MDEEDIGTKTLGVNVQIAEEFDSFGSNQINALTFHTGKNK